MQNKHNNFQPQQQPYFLFLHILKFRKGQNETWITKIESFRSKNETKTSTGFTTNFLHALHHGQLHVQTMTKRKNL